MVNRITTSENKRIVCLGGGIGTVNLIKGLKEYTNKITVVVSMADDGGSAGRLRRMYSVPPTGDLVSCIAALSNAEEMMKELLTYRFSGKRYGSDHSLPGHKLGNLIFVALTSITGDFTKALSEMHRLFKIKGKILPSTIEDLSIWAKTSTGEEVHREQNIDLGKFNGRISELHLNPEHPRSPKEVKETILQAEAIIAGPGDLYTTVLPVLMVPDVFEATKKSKAKKIFVVNVANKPFETKDYSIGDFVNAIVKHLSLFPFGTIIANNSYKAPIPRQFRDQYEYVKSSTEGISEFKIIKRDLVNESFPLYHDSAKLAKVIMDTI